MNGLEQMGLESIPGSKGNWLYSTLQFLLFHEDTLYCKEEGIPDLSIWGPENQCDALITLLTLQ